MANDTSESLTGAARASAYQNAWEHLSDELTKLDAFIHLEVLKLRKQRTRSRMDEFTGMYISEDEIDNILQQESTQHNSDAASTNSRIQLQRKQIEIFQTTISTRVDESLKAGIFLPLYQLSRLFHLTLFDLNTILICLAPELDLKYEKLYAYVQDDVTKKSPSVNLILNLLCNNHEERINARTYFGSHVPLLKYALLRFVDDSEQKPLLGRFLKLDDRIVEFLLGCNLLDARLNAFASIIHPEQDWSTIILDHDLKEQLRRLSQEHFHHDTDKKLIFAFFGPQGAGKKLVAEAICQDLQLPLIIVNTPELVQTERELGKNITWLFRETVLQPAAIYFEHVDQLLADDAKSLHHKNMLREVIEECSIVTFLSGEKAWSPPVTMKQQVFIKIEFPIPTYSSRKHLWEVFLDDQPPLAPDVNVDALANKFRFTGGQIQEAISEAGNRAIMHQHNDGGSITMDDFYQSCRDQSNQTLSALAHKIIPHYTWNDLVLPVDKFQQLEELCNYVTHRQIVYADWGFEQKLSLGKWLNALFSGPSGTGKTMAAEIIANELKLDLYKIDLSCVVSKYIGETEKNLAKIFQEAETSNAILFFDEADALFGKRSEVKDAHDRYANIEIGYLLQKMEEHEGIVILASNFRKNIDGAFARRMHFMVEFLFPDETYRLKIWQQIFPFQTPISKEIDFAFLAKQFKLTGGNIKNIAIHAAFLAAESTKIVTMAHIILGMKREYQKMSKLCIQTDFGKYFELVESEEENG